MTEIQGLQMSQSASTPLATKSTLPRLAAILFVMALIAAACGGGSETISLGDDGLTAPAPDGDVELPESAERVDFNYESFDGETLALSGLGDRPVVLNFFASWCPTCIAELPDFERVSQTFVDDVQFLGLSVQDQPDLSLQLLGETGVTFPTGLDTPGDIFASFGGLGMPTTVFITADGEVANVHTGVLTEEALAEDIAEFLLP